MNWFSKKDTPPAGKIIVTFYFVSGEQMDIAFSDEKWNEILNILKKTWNDLYCTNSSYGINFSLVTHYEVK